jgi:hypothetical protein
MSTTPKIIQNPNDLVPQEILATAIRDLASGMRSLNAGPLKRAAIVLLLNDMCGIGKRNIEYVLNSMEALESTYLKKRS